jgi:hypothetical protein
MRDGRHFCHNRSFYKRLYMRKAGLSSGIHVSKTYTFPDRGQLTTVSHFVLKMNFMNHFNVESTDCSLSCVA